MTDSLGRLPWRVRIFLGQDNLLEWLFQGELISERDFE